MVGVDVLVKLVFIDLKLVKIHNLANTILLPFRLLFNMKMILIFFSLIPPYSYSKLISFLQSSSITVSDKSNINFDYKTIAFTLSNTQVPYVKISNRLNASKKNIIILARQHPG